MVWLIRLEGKVFQSTPSPRRATIYDSYACRIDKDFNPRPPRGGRQRLDAILEAMTEISIHALPAEGDQAAPQHRYIFLTFQSTPSPRRATPDIPR